MPERDWATSVAVIGGVGALGLGAWLMFRKVGAEPGDELIALSNFEYDGPAAGYVLQLSLGKIVIGGWFDRAEGMIYTSTIFLEEPGRYEEELAITIPMGAATGSYDAECLIRTPEMGDREYLIKVVLKGALKVVEPK